jgi:hypothetical protein
MKTSEYLIYGTIIFLLYKLYKNTQPGGEMDKSNPTAKKAVINLPPFATVTPTYWNKTQVQPTPAEVLNPEQLAYYNAKIKGISKHYTC